MLSDLQRAGLWKRLSAGLFDSIMLCILAVGAAWLLAVFTNYDGYSQTMTDSFAHYEEVYGVTFSMTLEEYNAMTDAQRDNYNAAYDALCQDETAMRAYNMTINLSLLICTFGILLAVLAMEFAVPLFFGHGQTLGKKIFGICLMRTDGIRVNAPLLFIRTVLGKYTLEIMLPVLILVMISFNMAGAGGILLLAGIIVLELILFAATKNHAAIHDLLAKTVVVDYHSQRIFDSEAELIAYKTARAYENVQKSKYGET